jgi:NADH-quinone oxidoreductase subunit G
LRGGDPGRRLIEAPENAETSFFTDVPPRSETPPGNYLLVPAHHIFGSEELSALAPGIAKLAPQPYAGLSSDDGNKMALEPGQVVELLLEGRSLRLPVRIIEGLPVGTVALPVGLSGIERLELPALAQLRNPRDEKGAAS